MPSQLLLQRRGIFSQPIGPAFPASGLIGRLRADSITGVADGAAVATWPGLTGGDATQATGANRPTYTASGINGKPSVSFDGSLQQYMNWPGVPGDTPTFTELVVWRTVAGPSGNMMLLGTTGSGGASFYLNILGSTRFELDGVTSLAVYVASAYNGSQNFASLMAFDNAVAANAYGYVNGASIGSGGGTTGQSFTAGRTAVVGHGLGGATYYMTGQIAEICKWNKVLSAAERSQVFAYTLARYGV
jgi:hypothetical protein